MISAMISKVAVAALRKNTVSPVVWAVMGFAAFGFAAFFFFTF